MAKTIITDSVEGTKVPFLRGILTRSLTDAGMPFDEAYNLATTIRQRISHKSNLTTQQLRQLVQQELEKRQAHEIFEAYEHATQTTQFRVRSRSDQITSFSWAEHRRSLTSTGLAADKASPITQAVYKRLSEAQIAETSSNKIGLLTYHEVRRQIGKQEADRYLVWIDYKRRQRPLVILIGGTTGCGKSTIATEVAHRLGIIRTQSTDMLREVMRMLIPERLLPALHTSSFSAWRKMPTYRELTEATEETMINGYLHQSELVSVPCEAVIQRALSERVSLILEGVHVNPALVERFQTAQDAVIVPVMLAVLKQGRLKRHLKGRGVVTPDRSESSQYLSNFDNIWALQSYLLSEADSSTMPILENDDKEQTTDQVMRTIMEVLKSDFRATAEETFGA